MYLRRSVRWKHAVAKKNAESGIYIYIYAVTVRFKIPFVGRILLSSRYFGTRVILRTTRSDSKTGGGNYEGVCVGIFVFSDFIQNPLRNFVLILTLQIPLNSESINENRESRDIALYRLLSYFDATNGYFTLFLYVELIHLIFLLYFFH